MGVQTLSNADLWGQGGLCLTSEEQDEISFYFYFYFFSG